MSRIVYIDPSLSGASGDMFLGALLGLGADLKKLRAVARGVSRVSGCKVGLRTERVKRCGLAALRVDVEVEGKGSTGIGSMADIPPIMEGLGLGKEARRFVENAYKTLMETEARSHGTVPEKVHLEELGSADTLLDFAGTAILAEDLGLFQKEVAIYSGPVAMGRGRVNTLGGIMPLPPPVTTQILKEYKIPFLFLPVEIELTTPTGATILANLVRSFSEPPAMRIEAVGMGAGSMDLPSTPNLLRVLDGDAAGPGHFVSVLETNLDDATGEVMGYTMERLYLEGALDVQIIPTVTKKGRPGHIMMVICTQALEEKLTGILMEETGTLGVRVGLAHKRVVAERDVMPVEIELGGYKGRARVKVARDKRGKVGNLKAEYEDARRIAKATGLPLRTVTQRIEEEARSRL